MADVDTGAEIVVSEKDRGMMEIKKGPRSTRFVDGLLEDIRSRNESARETYKLETEDGINQYARDLVQRTHVPTYLTDYFSESINDGIDNKSRRTEFEKLKRLRETSAKIAAGIKVSEEELEDINSYIDTQFGYWRGQAEGLKGKEQQAARETQGVFRAFQMILENPVILEDIVNGPEAPAADAKIEKTPEQEDLPEMQFVPTDFLDKQESDNVDYNVLYDYLGESRKGLYAEEREFKQSNPVLSTAVRSGWEYYEKHKAATEDIMVVVENGQAIYAGGRSSAPPERERTEKDTFIFNTDTHFDTRNGIGANAARLQRYEARIDDLDRGIGAVRTLMESDKAVLAGREGIKDQLAIIRILDMHRGHIAFVEADTETGEPADVKEARIKKKWDVIKEFYKLVDSRVSAKAERKTGKKEGRKKEGKEKKKKKD